MDAKTIAYILVGIFSGPFISLAATPIFCLLRKIFFVPLIRKKLLDKATEKGHVLEATLLKKHNVVNDTEFGNVATMEYVGIYSYQLNGKTYKRRLLSRNTLPSKITLYYIKKPRKATVADELGNWETPWFRFYLMISLVSSIIAVVVGLIIG